MPRYKFYITAKRLRANGACEEEVAKFERVFSPHGKVAMTDANFERAVEAKLQIWWLAFAYLGSAAWTLDGDDFGPDYEPNARRYWAAIKAKMAKDRKTRPPEWF